MPSYTTRHRSVPCARTLTSVRLPPSFWTVSQARGWKLSLILAAGRMLGYNRFSVPQKQAWFPTSYQPGLVCFMELTFLCPDCGAVNHVQSLQAAERGACSACGAGRSLHHEVIEDGQLRACPWCATSDLYIQKDFPQGLGLSIVIVGFVISTIFWYLEKPILTYLVLLASALLDMVLYYRVPDVTICYRCLSQIRGAGSNPENRIGPFDLAVGERYRQERLRIEELRKRVENVEPSSPPVSTHP